jgi:predicted transcriptional regulator
MDKILSARVDESVIRHIGMLAERLHLPKKAIIEKAIESYSRQVGADAAVDVLDQTLGAWCRNESPDETVLTARQAFQESMERHPR